MRGMIVFGLMFAGVFAVVPAAGDGQFVRQYWYERGIEHGNPKEFVGRDIRVNAPEAVVGRFADRNEVRDNGLAVILMEQDLTQLEGAELYVEHWGGHPGTDGHRVTVNGRTTYEFPDYGVADGHCVHGYPTFSVNVTDLVNGYNAIQFACDEGTTFWGHFIVDNVALRAVLGRDHPDVEAAGLAGFAPELEASPGEDETIEIALNVPQAYYDQIEKVVFEGRYFGYDENGNRSWNDWHGFTKEREPKAVLGVVDEGPYEITWEVSMLPAQENVAVRAQVHFDNPGQMLYEVPVVEGLRVPDRAAERVELFKSTDIPVPYWSRAGREVVGTIEMPIDPQRIERAELHVVIWDGGRGSTEHPFRLNGVPVDIAGDGAHDTIYRVREIDPEILVQGDNELLVLAETEHHGMEVLLPGPALMIRYTE